jgi:hypothetical protein
MPRKQMNIRLDELTRETIKRIAERWNMSESQVITRGILLLEESLKNQANVATNVADETTPLGMPQQDA